MKVSFFKENNSILILNIKDLNMKKILVIIMIFCAGYTQAQEQKSKTTVSSFSIETNSLNELKNFDWRSVKKFFKDNEKNDSIQIKFYLKNDKDSSKELNLNVSSTTIKGQTHELKEMIRTAKRMTKEIIKINKYFKD